MRIILIRGDACVANGIARALGVSRENSFAEAAVDSGGELVPARAVSWRCRIAPCERQGALYKGPVLPHSLSSGL